MMIALFPYFIVISAVTFYATLSPMAKKIGFQVPPFSLIAASSFILFCVAGIIALLKEKHIVISNFDKIEWPWLLAFSLTNLIGYFLYLIALSKMPVAQYQIIGLLSPVIGGLIAVYLLKEPLQARYILAMAFMAIGVFIAIWPNLKGE